MLYLTLYQSARALYVVSYDYALEKVVQYTRIALEHIRSIVSGKFFSIYLMTMLSDGFKGEYILSTLDEGSRDTQQNYGFLINYDASFDMTRVSGYSVKNRANSYPTPKPDASVTKKSSTPVFLSRMLINVAPPPDLDEQTFVAFKALPIDPARIRRTTGSFEEPVTGSDHLWVTNCKEAVDAMVDTIAQAVKSCSPDQVFELEKGPIVSLQEAQRSTTVMAKMEYEFKRLLWLGN